MKTSTSVVLTKPSASHTALALRQQFEKLIMDEARRSLLEHQSVMATQAQLLAHQQHRQQRASSYFPAAAPPMLAAPASLSGYFPMQTAAIMQAPPMVAVAKLANSKSKKETNSFLVVRSTVARFNVSGGLYTVAQWARKCVEENLEWIVKLVRRHHTNENVVLLTYGDGCQTIVLLDDAINVVPQDIKKIPKIGIGVSSAPKDAKDDERKMAKEGVLQPTDSLWDHLRNAQIDISTDKMEKILFLHTSMVNYGEAMDGRRRILQVKTDAPKNPLEALRYVPNPVFEQQVLVQWKSGGSGVTPERIAPYSLAMMPNAGMMFANPNIGMAAATHLATTTAKEEEGILITFNPKELILLEKAFDNKLTTRDLKSKADKWSEDDKKSCQMVIKRANDEFKWVVVRKQKSVVKSIGATSSTKKQMEGEEKKLETKMTTQAKKPAVTDQKKIQDEKKPARGVQKAKNSFVEKSVSNMSSKEDDADSDDEPADSDDEPISKLKEKKEKASPTKQKASKVRSPAQKAATLAKKKSISTPTTKATRVAAKKEEKPSPKKRGRPAKKETVPPAKKTRRPTSNSRSRK